MVITWAQSQRSPLPANVKAAVKRWAHAVLSALMALYAAWTELKHRCAAWWASAAASTPRLRSALRFWPARTAAAGGGGGRGAAPRPPRILGVVLAQQHQGEEYDQALCRLLTWAQQQGFVQVFLYDPGGALQRRERELKQALRWADPFQRIAVWAGWRAPPEWTATATDADKSADAAGRSMGVALLSAADAEWPLQAAGGAMEDPGGVDCNSASPQGTLEEAIAAPLELKRKLGRVAGPMAELEPDLVLVFGKVLTLAGYPPWATRVAEVYGAGSLGGLTRGRLDAVLQRFAGTRQRFGR